MKKQPLIEIWGDVVSIKGLRNGIVIVTLTTLGLHLLAPSDNRTLGLFFGLLGAVIGFIIVTALNRPHRIIEKETQSHD